MMNQAVLDLPARDTIVLAPSDRARRIWSRWWRAEALARSAPGEAAALPAFFTVEEWLRRLWQEARAVWLVPNHYDLAPPEVEAMLWRRVVDEHFGDGLGAHAPLAEEAQEAWRLLQAHTPLERIDLSEATLAECATEAGRRVMGAVRDRLRERGAMSEAELPRRIAHALPALAPLLPRQIVLTPRFAPRPDEVALFERLEALAGCCIHRLDAAPSHEIESRAAPRQVRRWSFPSARAEREAALTWAAQRLARTGERSALPLLIVVPGLPECAEAWRRSADWVGIEVDVSAGRPLARYPWAAVGFTVVAAAFEPVSVEVLGQALTHERWAFSAAERACLARIAPELAERGVRSIGLVAALRQAGLTVRAQAVERVLTEAGEPSRARPRRTWATLYARLIGLFSQEEAARRADPWPIERALLSAIERWCALDDWLPTVEHRAAQAELIALTEREPFQPHAPAHAVQVIGLLESGGLPHAGLWFVDATDQRLPEAVRLNAFLDASWQRVARAGRARPESVLDRASRLVAHWRMLGPECCASLVKLPGERVSWAPGVADWPLAEESPGLPGTQTGALDPAAWPELQWCEDEGGLPAPGATQPGQTKGQHDRMPGAARPGWPKSPRPLDVEAFAQQAECPRRGYAMHRLGLAAWPVAAVGVSPSLRGGWLHAALERYGRCVAGRASPTLPWDLLHRQASTWVEEAEAELRERLTAVPDHIVAAERARLTALMRRFLECEQHRAAFLVLEVESRREFTLSGLPVRVRLDRIDRLLLEEQQQGAEVPSEALLVIDYKSGRVSPTALSEARLVAPQLPLYTLALGPERVRGAALAQLDDEQVRFHALGDGWAKSKHATSFAALKSEWTRQLEALAQEIARGEAVRAPFRGAKSCEACPVRTFCGIDRVWPQWVETADEPAQSEGPA
ncbi:MAG: PD-(D/E)XK nuclease family protein [Burkholderiales bacterium]|nr:PD-(D/E)XK nuclease family protein [Burkholderiales bacterium]